MDKNVFEGWFSVGHSDISELSVDNVKYVKCEQRAFYAGSILCPLTLTPIHTKKQGEGRNLLNMMYMLYFLLWSYHEYMHMSKFIKMYMVNMSNFIYLLVLIYLTKEIKLRFFLICKKSKLKGTMIELKDSL